MLKIIIISSSVRINRKSHVVASYFENYLLENDLSDAEILDLKKYNFPLFNERLRFQESPSPATLTFAEKVREADGVIIVTPEYNGGYPASLKNIIDLLTDEWRHKPVAISTVSDGIFGGSQVITSLQFTLWKMKALTVPAMFPVPRVDDLFNKDGLPVDKSALDKRAASFIKELFKCITAAKAGPL
ncbi:MAG: NAD(P)H-dependent oxidoreductase [Bacteroidetes bacterium]|jgi:NAD(P)H-dependent FMN reductase|nr:NAD(P)H-dependent oxidoreductase [Bacteroidota bacterium]